ncbi:hypothetical protein SK128_009896 [Halocaridina rubra]|uniref:Arrestin-like N-terminal domain-containing protein n=1 Tax=Halocaridina rubra TaxID=373956 RepID=A0AAN8XLV0_HALRR
MRFRGECCIHFTDLPRATKLELLRKGKSITKRRRSSFSTISSPQRSHRYQNGNLLGVDNPGFIPDNDVGSLPNPFRNHSISNGPTTIHRPNSSEHSWRETSVSGPLQHFRAQETYFDCEFYIYGHKYQKDEREMLPAGLHEFPFAFNLPPNLPPSFNSEKGFVTYMAVAILDRPAAANLVQKAGFSVHAILDLNMDTFADCTNGVSLIGLEAFKKPSHVISQL